MIAQEPENADDESINPQTLSWIEAQRESIKNDSPETLRDQLNGQLDKFTNSGFSGAEETMAIRGFEVLITQAKKLQKLLGHFETELAQAAQSNTTVDTEVELFWAKFEDDALDPNQFKKLEDYLKEQFHKHAKETQVVNEVSKKINEEIEPEMQSFLPFYFNSKDRGLIYAEMAKLGSVENVNKYRQKILKAREKREKYVATKLQEIWEKKTDPKSGKKALNLIRKKCGDGVFQLPHVIEAQNFVNNVAEADSDVKDVKTEFDRAIENANESYFELTGENHPDFDQVVEEHETEEKIQQAAEQEKTVTESYESAESKIKVIEALRTEAQNSAKYWGEKANDRGHGSRGVGTTMKLLAAGAMDGYSLENYEEEIGKVGHLVPHNNKYAKTEGRKIPEIFYDIPTDAANFNASMAASTASKIKAAKNLSEHGRAAGSLFYNNFYKDKDPSMVTPSINEFIGSCNSMIKQLTAGKTVMAQAA